MGTSDTYLGPIHTNFASAVPQRPIWLRMVPNVTLFRVPTVQTGESAASLPFLSSLVLENRRSTLHNISSPPRL